MSNFVFVKSLQRYRNVTTGRLISSNAIEKLISDRVSTLNKDLESINELLLEGKLSLKNWEKQIVANLKTLVIQQFILGRGGASNTTESDRTLINKLLREEFDYLSNFASDLTEATMSVAQVKNRLSLYADKTRFFYDKGRETSHEREEFLYCRRLLGRRSRSCPDCIRYAGLGIVPLYTVPLPREKCACGSSCNCLIFFFKSFEDAINLSTFA